MTAQSWNEEQIKAAFDDSIDDGIRFTQRSKAVFMQALTKPKPVFKVGEVVMKKLKDATMWEVMFWRDDFVINDVFEYRRPLSEEVPALALAIESFEGIRKTVDCGKPTKHLIDITLSRIKEMC